MAARAPAGIREDISAKDKLRYQAWKDEFLSTETGLREWQTYARDTRFALTITTSSDNRHGAEIGRYEWDDTGHLAAATITLGIRLDEEYPEPVYYPVMNALKHEEFRYAISRSTLAATKIAHEFGHLSRMITTDAAVYRLQAELVPAYNAIMMKNGWNSRDPRLQDLAGRMGGTPVEIWEDFESTGARRTRCCICATASPTARFSVRCFRTSSETSIPTRPRNTAAGLRRSPRRRRREGTAGCSRRALTSNT